MGRCLDTFSWKALKVRPKQVVALARLRAPWTVLVGSPRLWNNTGPDGSSRVLRHVSIRHGSTNLGWNQFLNGNETDCSIGGCGSGTEVEYVNCGSADDGLHIWEAPWGCHDQPFTQKSVK